MQKLIFLTFFLFYFPNICLSMPTLDSSHPHFINTQPDVYENGYRIFIDDQVALALRDMAGSESISFIEGYVGAFVKGLNSMEPCLAQIVGFQKSCSTDYKTLVNTWLRVNKEMTPDDVRKYLIIYSEIQLDATNHDNTEKRKINWHYSKDALAVALGGDLIANRSREGLNTEINTKHLVWPVADKQYKQTKTYNDLIISLLNGDHLSALKTIRSVPDKELKLIKNSAHRFLGASK